jgi:hypothetical protein
MFFNRKGLEELSEPIFERFAERLGEDDRLVLDAVTHRLDAPRARPEVEEMICREVLERLLPCLARDVGVSLEALRRQLGEVRARLDRLPRDSAQKRVYVAVSTLQRCATRAQERSAIACARRALAMPRNTVDVYKRRAIRALSEGTCFVRGTREAMGELHLFVLDVAPHLRAAARDLLDNYCADEAGERTARLHEERNHLRKVYEDKCEQAKDLFTTELPAVFDASTTHPIDVAAEFEARLRALSVPPEQIAARAERWWHTLRISGTVPRRVLPTTTWTRILRDADRPPTWVLEGAWQQLVHGRGIVLWETLQRLIQAAKEADAARDAWIHASELSLEATQGEPAALKDAIAKFNRSLDEVLAHPAKGEMSK